MYLWRLFIQGEKENYYIRIQYLILNSVAQLPAELRMRVTGTMNGWLVLCAAFGELSVPLILAYAFAKFSPQILPLVILTTIFSMLMMYISVWKTSK